MTFNSTITDVCFKVTLILNNVPAINKSRQSFGELKKIMKILIADV